MIAVSVTAHLESQFAKNRLDTPTSKMRSPSALQTILRSYLVQNVNMNSVGVQPADVVIEPDVTSIGIGDFAKTRELSAIGEKTAREAIPKIKSLLAQLDKELLSHAAEIPPPRPAIRLFLSPDIKQLRRRKLDCPRKKWQNCGQSK